MKRDILITARVPEDDEDTPIIASGVQGPADAVAQAVEVLHADTAEEELELYRSHYAADDGIYVISFSCAPTGLMQEGHNLQVTWPLIGRLLWAACYYTVCLLFRRTG